MNEKKKASGLPWLPVVLFIAAAALIAMSAIGGVRAALNVESENYVGSFEVQNIGVALTENGYEKEGSDALLTELVPEGEEFSLNKEYAVKLAAVNTGEIDEYVRAQVYKYWVDAKGNKVTTLSPELIDLTYNDSAWIVASTTAEGSGERTVLYYPAAVASGDGTAPFVTAVTISGDIAQPSYQTIEDNVLTTVYEYDGVSFVVEAEVDAVQTHSAQAAIKAAWGVDAAISDSGVITGVTG